MSAYSNKFQVRLVLYILLIIWLVQPQFVFTGLIGVVGYEKSISVILCIVLFTLLIQKINSLDKVFTFIVLIQISFLLMHSALHQDLDGNLPFIGKLAVLPILFIAIKTIGYRVASDLFIKLILFLSAVGFIDFVIKLIGVNVTYYEFNNYGGHTLLFSGLSTFNKASYYLDGFSIYRSTYFFDEPGTYSFMMASALSLNIIFGFNKKREYFLLGLGICSFSLYYFIILCLYLIFILITEKKIFLFAYILIFLILFAFLTDNKFSKIIEFSNKQYISRLINTFEDSNRHRGVKRAVDVFANNIFIGGGRFLNDQKKIAGSSYLRFFAMFGIFGAIILLAHIIIFLALIIISKVDLTKKLFIIISVCVMLLHREHVIQLLAYSLIFIMYKQLKTSNAKLALAEINFHSYNYNPISIRR